MSKPGWGSMKHAWNKMAEQERCDQSWNRARVYLLKYNITNKLAPETLQQWWRYSHTSSSSNNAREQPSPRDQTNDKNFHKSKRKTLNNNLLKYMWDFYTTTHAYTIKELTRLSEASNCFSLPSPKTADLTATKTTKNSSQ